MRNEGTRYREDGKFILISGVLCAENLHGLRYVRKIVLT